MNNSESISQDSAQITRVYWESLNELLKPKFPKVQSLPGFDDEFVDIVDYIIKITHRIWEQKDVGLCEQYYSDFCPVHTVGDYSESVQTVTENTLKTIAAFPDRSLIGENVVWRDMGDEGFYSSHRITSIMTNKGTSEFGPATGQTGRVTTIADCICQNNRVVYEWLMRDNSFLIKQLGLNILDVVQHKAKSPAHPKFLSWRKNEIKRIREQKPYEKYRHPDSNDFSTEFAHKWVDTFLNKKLFSHLKDFYAVNAHCQWPGGREFSGLPGICGNLIQWLAQCPDAQATCDHVAMVPFDDEGTFDIAIRWSLVGKFRPDSKQLEHLRGLDYFILAGTHLRVKNQQVQQEWTVFDEVDALTNLFRDHANNHERSH